MSSIAERLERTTSALDVAVNELVGIEIALPPDARDALSDLQSAIKTARDCFWYAREAIAVEEARASLHLVAYEDLAS